MRFRFLPDTQAIYPPQRKRLVGLLPQLDEDDAEDVLELANNEICLLVLVPAQVGQLGD
jgi:hypothetical protein